MLSGSWELDNSKRNLFYLAKSYDFASEFFMSVDLRPLRRQLISESSDRSDRSAINNELVVRPNKGGNPGFPLIANCAHLACELALKQFLVRQAFCEGAKRINARVPSGLSFPATHKELFNGLESVHKALLHNAYGSWLLRVSPPHSPKTDCLTLIADFSSEQLDFRYNTISDPCDEKLISVTTASRFLCRGFSNTN
jgi:hypothetical protein